MNERERRYQEEFGEEALERQRQAAKDFHWCCGEPVAGPHHEVCKHYVQDEVPAVIEGQESML